MSAIVLDGLPLQVRSAGIGTYTDALVRQLAADHPQRRFLLYGLGGAATRLLPAAPSLAPLPPNVGWLPRATYPLVMGFPPAGTPRLLPLRQADMVLFHATNYAAPRRLAAPLVVTMHDLALLRFPALGTPSLRRLVARAAAALPAARLVIADSQATARDLRELAGVPTARLRVVHPGGGEPPPRIERDAAQQHLAARFGLAEPPIVHIGTLEPRKNLDRLVRAYAQARAARRDLPPLVLAGARGWGCEALLAAIAAPPLAGAVRWLGPVSNDDRAALYAAAALVVYPSVYEGFGLPLVEAMAAGAPVLTTNVASLPEIAGDAAALVDPHDETALAAALLALLGDGATRAELARRGPARAAQFTWARCAAETWAVYEEAMRDAPR
jgi:glycosyltransferase involved in cell wall biosynthesis